MAGMCNMGTVDLRRGGEEEESVVVRVVHISDTHSKDYDNKIPMGDILVHSGDFTHRGTESEIKKFSSFLSRQPHRYKVVVCGNHEKDLDNYSTEEVAKMLGDDVIVLEETRVTLLGIKFWGSPSNMSKAAYGASLEKREKIWQQIPSDTDVLITHQPPYSVKDLAWIGNRYVEGADQPCDLCNGAIHPIFSHWGCPSLLKHVTRLQIPLHLFGHVHDDVGIEERNGTVFSNAAMDIAKIPSLLEVTVPVSRTCTKREQWPLDKIRTEIDLLSVKSSLSSETLSVFRSDSKESSKPRAVLLTTGAMNPVHKGHLLMMEKSKMFIESELGFDVVGGFLSPSSDIYVKPKMMTFQQKGEPLEASFSDATHRVRLTEMAVMDSDWLMCSSWEAEQSKFRDFDEVLYSLDMVLREKNIFNSENDKVFYVCGSDHFNKCGLQNGIFCRDDRLARPVAVVCRAEDEVQQSTPKSEHAHVVPHECQPSSLTECNTATSSTMVRNLLNRLDTCCANEDETSNTLHRLREMLPTSVYEDLTAGQGKALYRMNTKK